MRAISPAGRSPSPPDVETAAALAVTIGRAAELAATRRRIRRWASDRLEPDEIDEVLLAVGEALANAVEHGLPPIRVALRWESNAPRTLVIEVRDSGGWQIASPRESRGMGIPIMTALTDAVSIDTLNGTEVRLVRRF